MRLHLRLGRQGLLMAMAMTVALVAPRRSSADVITIDDGKNPGLARLPFTCSVGVDNALWLPSMAFVYRNVEAFKLTPGDTIAFDLQVPGKADLGFHPQLDIALAHASDPLNPFKPDQLGGASDFTTVANGAIAASPGNQTAGDYDLAFTVDKPFSFPGGGLIIRVSNPQGTLAVKTDSDCVAAVAADRLPSGTNRLVGTVAQEPLPSKFPWQNLQNTINDPYVPYVQIKWTRCGDGLVSGGEQCDDANADNTDGCTNTCLAAACGDGVLQNNEECDNSTNPDKPDPFCDTNCHLDAFAKGSGCSTGGGAGLVVAAMMMLAFGRRRRGTKSTP